MTVSITIGERIEDHSGSQPYVTVFRWGDPKAPLFPGDEITGHSNQRHFGFEDYQAFAQHTALIVTLLAPVETAADGICDLEEDDLSVVLRISAEWQAAHQVTPTFESEDEADWHLARLLWFAWWIEWALKHTTHLSLARSS